MYIRYVTTASGATAVQIVEKHRGQRRIVKHIGSAHTEAELGVLVAQARAVLNPPDQMLDLDIEEQPLLVQLREPPPATTEISLPGLTTDDEIDSDHTKARSTAARTIGTSSRLLYDLLGGVFDGLDFDEVEDTVFRDLVIARIVEPTSKLDAGRVLHDLGADPASYATVKRRLRRIIDEDYRSTLATACAEYAKAAGGLALVLYDVTTLFFEAEHEDTLRKVGFSKERRVDPQIVVGLLVDRHGFPLEIGCFEGNKAETLTMLPVIRGFLDRHELDDLVVVADAGMLSASNLQAIEDAGLRFIVGSRISKAPYDLHDHFKRHGTGFDDGQIINTTTKLGRAQTEYRIVYQYSKKRWVRDNQTINLQQQRAMAFLAGEKTARKPRFLKTKRGQSKGELDDAAIETARKLAGLKGYVTNLSPERMSGKQVIGSYHDLWQVERSFRMSKSDLAARPIFHRQLDSIEAHLTVVFAALAVARRVEAATGRSIGAVVKALRPLRSARISINGAEQTFPPQIPDELEPMITALRQAATGALSK